MRNIVTEDFVTADVLPSHLFTDYDMVERIMATCRSCGRFGGVWFMGRQVTKREAINAIIHAGWSSTKPRRCPDCAG